MLIEIIAGWVYLGVNMTTLRVTSLVGTIICLGVFFERGSK